ncbi:hypothetical protein EJ03DRAFT_38967 [Teratosphaeria nubilosa]|uniref:Survival Motor Neuron Gemin2-binding domain-containing protein n=1 Tax=Teratosphaeria nubilosa TaxID=161662 RepID=A0A6G1LFI3_9PEZI|nr:hypothetical protein EJ03DRAFT_38967 [Teratosphaeria nubilosa]
MAEDETRHLSHAEVWDDSVLVKSWNEALAEYKQYHSLAAKGEKIDIVPDEAEEGEVEDAAAEDETAHDQDVTVEQPPQVNGAEAEPATALPANGMAAPPVAPALPGGAAVPQALMSTVQDEGLKNIMMSWYYAGYYTGVYEGQQKAYAAMQQKG